jgi:hypothetical protein
MKIMKLVGLILWLGINLGDLVAQNVSNPLDHEWVKMHDQATGLETAFPQNPIDITYDLPFDTPPPAGRLHLYSAPVPHGVLVAGALVSDFVTAELIKEKAFKKFFESVIIPRLLYYPHVFRQEQHFQTQQDKDSLSFQVTYLDHQTRKQMEGKAFVNNQKIFFAFYLATEESFDNQLFKKFIQSVHISD